MNYFWPNAVCCYSGPSLSLSYGTIEDSFWGRDKCTLLSRLPPCPYLAYGSEAGFSPTISLPEQEVESWVDESSGMKASLRRPSHKDASENTTQRKKPTFTASGADILTGLAIGAIQLSQYHQNPATRHLQSLIAVTPPPDAKFSQSDSVSTPWVPLTTKESVGTRPLLPLERASMGTAAYQKGLALARDLAPRALLEMN